MPNYSKTDVILVRYPFSAWTGRCGTGWDWDTCIIAQSATVHPNDPNDPSDAKDGRDPDRMSRIRRSYGLAAKTKAEKPASL